MTALRTVADNLEAARHYQRQYRRLRIEQFIERNWFYLAVAVFTVSVFAAAFVGGAS